MKDMNSDQYQPSILPIIRDLKMETILSSIIAMLMATVSIVGIIFKTAIYPTDEMVQSFLATDVASLLIGVPMLIGSIWLARRGKLIGLLFWPGALFYVLYNYSVYVYAMPFNVVFLMYLALVILSLYTLINLVKSIDAQAVQRRLSGAVPERLSGAVLAGLGSLFFLRVFFVLASALINQTKITETEIALLISDFLFSPAWVICGLLLWRRKAFGYLAGLGMLFQASMLFIGLIIVLIVNPIITTVPFILLDVVVVFIMGLICFIPLALFARGVISSWKQTPP
jgi:hypothetical protein